MADDLSRDPVMTNAPSREERGGRGVFATLPAVAMHVYLIGSCELKVGANYKGTRAGVNNTDKHSCTHGAGIVMSNVTFMHIVCFNEASHRAG